MYTCDNFVVLKIHDDSGVYYKLLTGTSGGYTTGDSWRMNSGIVNFEKQDEYHYVVHGNSGSKYLVHKESYGLRKNNAYVWKHLEEKYKDKIEKLEDRQDWSTFNFNE